MSADSDAVYSLYCQPCSGEGKHLEAEGYCDDCQEHLCQTCYKYHLIARPMKHHRLRDKSEMPRQMKEKPDANLPVCTDICPSHPNKVIEYFCKEHYQLGCSVCATLYHRGCDNIEYIPDVADKVADSEELKDLRWRLELLCNTMERIKEVSKRNKSEAEAYRKSVKAEIRKLTQAFTALMTKLESDINRKIDSIADKDIKLMNESAQESDAATNEVKNLMKELDEKDQNGQSCQLFVAMKKAEDNVKELEKRKTSMFLKTIISKYDFSPDTKWQKILDTSQSIGAVTIRRNSDMRATFHRSIDVNIPAYASPVPQKPEIHHGVLLKDKYLAVNNFFLSAVELIDVGRNKTISSVSMTTPPTCITALNGDQVIVAIPDESKLHFLSVAGNKLKDTDLDIQVDGECFGIVSTHHYLIVSFWESLKIEILDMNGTLMRRFNYTDDDGSYENDLPFLSISPCHDIIYVSNPGRNKVVSLTLDGKVLNTYTDDRLCGPTYVMTDKVGNVFVCGLLSNNVHFLTSDLKKIKILIKGNGVRGPGVVCRNNSTDRMFIYMHFLRKFKEYQLKY